MFLNIILNITLLTIFDSISLGCLKQYHLYKNWKIIIPAILINAIIIPILLINTFKYEGLAITNFLWNIFSTLAVIFVGVYFFKEKINNYQKFGLFFGILSIFFLFLADSKS